MWELSLIPRPHLKKWNTALAVWKQAGPSGACWPGPVGQLGMGWGVNTKSCLKNQGRWPLRKDNWGCPLTSRCMCTEVRAMYLCAHGHVHTSVSYLVLSLCFHPFRSALLWNQKPREVHPSPHLCSKSQSVKGSWQIGSLNCFSNRLISFPRVRFRNVIAPPVCWCYMWVVFCCSWFLYLSKRTWNSFVEVFSLPSSFVIPTFDWQQNIVVADVGPHRALVGPLWSSHTLLCLALQAVRPLSHPYCSVAVTGSCHRLDMKKRLGVGTSVWPVTFWCISASLVFTIVRSLVVQIEKLPWAIPMHSGETPHYMKDQILCYV